MMWIEDKHFCGEKTHKKAVFTEPRFSKRAASPFLFPIVLYNVPYLSFIKKRMESLREIILLKNEIFDIVSE